MNALNSRLVAKKVLVWPQCANLTLKELSAQAALSNSIPQLFKTNTVGEMSMVFFLCRLPGSAHAVMSANERASPFLVFENARVCHIEKIFNFNDKI